MKRLGSDSSVYSEDEVRKHVFTILKAVHYMHSKHCVHRDIKPENVLLSDNSDEAEVRELTWPLRPSTHTHTHTSTRLEQVPHRGFACVCARRLQIKIVDLGLSRFFEERKLMRTICGTHKYLAPELVQCDRGQLQGYDKAIDMWGVGLLGFIMLYGFNPFARESQRETHNAIMRVEYAPAPPRPPASTPGELPLPRSTRLRVAAVARWPPLAAGRSPTGSASQTAQKIL